MRLLAFARTACVTLVRLSAAGLVEAVDRGAPVSRGCELADDVSTWRRRAKGARLERRLIAAHGHLGRSRSCRASCAPRARTAGPARASIAGRTAPGQPSGGVAAVRARSGRVPSPKRRYCRARPRRGTRASRSGAVDGRRSRAPIAIPVAARRPAGPRRLAGARRRGARVVPARQRRHPAAGLRPAARAPGRRRARVRDAVVRFDAAGHAIWNRFLRDGIPARASMRARPAPDRQRPARGAARSSPAATQETPT